MSTSYYDIGRALDTRLSTMTGVSPIAWEGADYKPVDGTLYTRPTNVFGDTVQITLGDADTGKDETIGVYFIDIFAPNGRGKKAGMQMADKVADRFRRRTNLVYNGTTVETTSVSVSAGNNEGNGWYKHQLIITYRVITGART